MGSPITFSGFNSIDFGLILNSIMTQESAPLTALQTRQTAVSTRIANFSTLATKTSTLETAAAALSSGSSLAGFSATSSDSSAIVVSSGSTAVAGHYDVVVNELARAQVMVSKSSAPDANKTIVASAGDITIGGRKVTITKDVTLQGLADAINNDLGMPAAASVVQDGSKSFRLVLTGKSTGSENAFTVTNALTGGAAPLAFTITTGVTGGNPLDNLAQQTATSRQVTASNTYSPDANTTTVASGGDITINGHKITIAGDVTLQGLADAINANTAVPATASIAQDANGYRLLLTAKSAGLGNGFTLTNALTGGDAPIAFTITTAAPGVSGGNSLDNVVQASDASLSVNNIQITSASNSLDTAIPGTSMTLLKKGVSVGVDVAADPSQLKSKVSDFISAYNDLVRFVSNQAVGADGGDDSSIARDPLVRQVRNSLRTALAATYGSGSPNNLSQIGIEFDRYGGTLRLNNATFGAAVKDGVAGLSSLFAGTAAKPGVFAAINTLLDDYTRSNGTIATLKKQLTAQITSMGDQIDRMQGRLALRRDALQKEFAAADQAMSALKSQSSSLTNFASSLTSSS